MDEEEHCDCDGKEAVQTREERAIGRRKKKTDIEQRAATRRTRIGVIDS